MRKSYESTSYFRRYTTYATLALQTASAVLPTFARAAENSNSTTIEERVASENSQLADTRLDDILTDINEQPPESTNRGGSAYPTNVRLPERDVGENQSDLRINYQRPRGLFGRIFASREQSLDSQPSRENQRRSENPSRYWTIRINPLTVILGGVAAYLGWRWYDAEQDKKEAERNRKTTSTPPSGGGDSGGGSAGG